MHQFVLDFILALWNTEYMDQSTQPTTPPPVIPPQTPPAHRNIVTIVIVAVIVAILASLGTYFVMSSNQNRQSQMSYQQPTTQVSPTQPMEDTSPTTSAPVGNVPANWKTYKTTTVSGLGYELKYPQTWSVQAWGGGGTNPVPIELAQVLTGQSCGNGHPDTDTITILHMMSANSQQQVTTSTNQLKKDGFVASTIMTGDGQSVEKLTGNPTEQTDYYTYIISPKGYYSIHTRDYCTVGGKEIFDQVVSTFKQAK
jgi:hypothetical protein